MTKLLILLSKALKRYSGHRKHFGYHVTYAGHLVDSCNSISGPIG
ncbi:Uncharacterised protein [Bordetella trematum]|uniref:Uncharacterized protein n=1 Tax=Bordetella trematum TaxID=123899 RepID=A0A157RWU7_9BORD|nr:Uncharacterised protein [Bordetella trematum]SAI61889.1 Uncharacterised protein [Bordetella trematum]SAI69045.1 Uncharacterised protein [Bordetella trematum]SUV99434.1 Uncharacterised protein [Bordetella trematum]